MAIKRRFVSLLSVVVVVVVGALVIGAFLALRNSVENQNHALLNTQAAEVTESLANGYNAAGTSFTAIYSAVAATGASPSAFQAEVASLASPALTIALVRSGEVLSVVGHGLIAGQALPPPLAAAVAHAAPGFSTSGVLRIGSEQVVGYIVGGGPTGPALVVELVVHPSVTQPSAKVPFTQINIAVYAATTARPDQLVLTTKRPLPLPGPVIDTVASLGTSKWLVVTNAVAPLAGAWPNALPWIVMGIGLLLALLLGAGVELLRRRERYATQMVVERTEELKASQRELVRRERLSAVGEMATMIGHELRNPLGATTNALFLVRSKLVGQNDPDIDHCLDVAELATSRAAALSEDLTTFMREREPQIERLDLRQVIDEVLALAPPPSSTDVSVPEPGVTVEADKALLIQMLSNVITNAYQAMPEGGSLRIDGSRNGGFTEITVQDSGPGIPEANADRLFDPFFSTKTVGTGLGLAIVKRLAEAHNGSVAIDNAPTGGALVTIHLPRLATEVKK